MMGKFALFLLISTLAVACAKPPAPDNTAIRAALASGRPTLADFGAQTCKPCQEMAPILDELNRELSGRANIIFIDLTDSKTMAKQYGIQVIPTQIFFNSQGKEVKRHLGFMDKQAILKELKGAGLD